MHCGGEGGAWHGPGLCHPLSLAFGKRCADDQDGEMAGGETGEQDRGGASQGWQDTQGGGGEQVSGTPALLTYPTHQNKYKNTNTNIKIQIKIQKYKYANMNTMAGHARRRRTSRWNTGSFSVAQ